MGIAVQAPADPLLAIVADLPAGEGATAASPLAEGMFAALLAGILNGQPPAVEEGAITGDALPLPADEPGDQNPDDLALALLAGIASPQPILHVADQGTGPASGQGAPTDTIAPASAPASSPAPAQDAATALGSAPPQEQAASTAASAVAEAVPGPAISASTPPEAQSPIPTPGTTAPPQSVAAVAASEPAAPIIQVPEPPAESAGPGPSDAPEPTAGEAAPAPEGVVRSVGNASESAPGKGGDHPGRKPEDSPPLPRASARGIAHAAPNSAVGELRQAATPEAAAPEAAGAPVPVEPPTELPQQVDQVATAVIERVEAGGGEARIHLEPLELGEVVIHVRTDGDEVRIDVRAERPDAARLLRDHTQDLSGLLGSRGLNLSDVNVGVGGGNAGSPFESRHEQPRPVAGDFAAVLGLDDVPSSAGLHNRLRATYNPDGALLYRV